MDPASVVRPRTLRRYQFGECFFEVSKDDADELLEKHKEEAEAEIAALGEELDKIKETLQSCKTALYARFGNNINLEE